MFPQKAIPHPKSIQDSTTTHLQFRDLLWIQKATSYNQRQVFVPQPSGGVRYGSWSAIVLGGHLRFPLQDGPIRFLGVNKQIPGWSAMCDNWCDFFSVGRISSGFFEGEFFLVDFGGGWWHGHVFFLTGRPPDRRDLESDMRQENPKSWSSFGCFGNPSKQAWFSSGIWEVSWNMMIHQGPSWCCVRTNLTSMTCCRVCESFDWKGWGFQMT